MRRRTVEVTPLTNRAFRFTRGLGGLALLLVAALTTIGLSACGAQQYTYVADSAAGTYYKVPFSWHQIAQKDLNAALQAAGGSGAGIWSTAFDAGTAPSANHFLAADVSQHAPVHLDARAQHLPAFFDHLLPLHRVVNDVTVFERQVIFAEHGAHALAPPAGRFQVSDNFRFIHNSVRLLTCHSCRDRAKRKKQQAPRERRSEPQIRSKFQ